MMTNTHALDNIGYGETSVSPLELTDHVIVV